MPAVTTPFTRDGRIDETSHADNLTRLLDAGATGFVVGGCTGEFWALTHEERKRLCSFSKEVVGDRGVILMGVGCITVDETVALSRHAESAGADGALIVPPYFVKLTDDELFRHYEDVSNRTGLPICLYNIPANAVNAITPALADRLAGLERVVAIKESSGDWANFYGTLIAVKDRLRVYCGPASVYGIPAVQQGADGLIDCFPNLWVADGLGMYGLAQSDDVARQREVQALGRRLTDLFVSFGGSLYPATKAALNLMGLPGGGHVRAPLRDTEGETLKALEAGLRTYGLL